VSKFDLSGSNFALERRISVITLFSIIFILSNIFFFFSIVEAATSTSETTMSEAEKWIREGHVAAQH
jgi:uncharacterized protein YybS (DUF2232 family)